MTTITTAYRRDSINPLYAHYSSVQDEEVTEWFNEQGELDSVPLFHRECTPLAISPSHTSTHSSPDPTSYNDSDNSDSDSDDESDFGFTYSSNEPATVWSVQDGYCIPTSRLAPVPVPVVPEEPLEIPSAAPFSFAPAARVVIPAPLSPRSRPVYDIVDDSEADAEGSSDGDATDDEYVPEPEYLHRSVRSVSRSSSADYDQVQSPRRQVSVGVSGGVKRQRAAPASRNLQVLRSEPYPTPSGSAPSARRHSKSEFICPDCGWQQKNKRMPDFKRHLRTHTRPTDNEPEKGWWCKGVPFEDASQHKLAPDAEPYLFLNQMRIGGCRRTFSRRDALKRHLDNHNVECVGRPTGATDE